VSCHLSLKVLRVCKIENIIHSNTANLLLRDFPFESASKSARYEPLIGLVELVEVQGRSR